jgi:hypothetical protein
MIMEVWLIATAIIFTIYGYWVGKQNGMEAGIDGTLAMLDAMEYISIKKLPNGEISIEKAGE